MLDLDLNQTKNSSQESAPPLDEKPKPKSGKTIWVAFILLLAGSVAAAIHGYRILRSENLQLALLPEFVTSNSVLGGRLDVIEARFQAWSENWNGLTVRVGKLESRMNARYNDARKYSEQLTAQVENRVQEQLDERAYLVDNRLHQLEAGQESESAQLASLRDELAATKQQLAQEIAAVREQSARELASVREQVEGNRRDVAAVNRRLDQQRVDFEASKGVTTELADGISLHVAHTDARFQRFKGWVSLVPEGRTLWVEDQGIQRPIVFFRSQEGARCELVVTRVAEDSTVGYLLLPVESTQSESQPLAELGAPSQTTR